MDPLVRGSKAKAMRRYVRVTYPYLSEDSLHQYNEVGVCTLVPMCQRALYQHMKRQYKRLFRRTDK
jgi:hypothetical protein